MLCCVIQSAIKRYNEGITMKLNLLNALKVKRAKKTVSDGGGLSLNVKEKTGSKSWVFRYTWEGKRAMMGLGPYPDLELSAARTMAQRLRDGVNAGIHPVATREAIKAENIAATTPPSIVNPKVKEQFANCAADYIETHKSGWKNEKHIQQWRNTLETYAVPHFGNRHVQQIALKDIKKMLDPIWYQKPETASRVQGRVERILDWATVQGYRTGDNPCRWRNFLQEIYPASEQVKLSLNGGEERHFASMPYEEVSDFYSELKKRNGVAVLALRFTILTAARSGEVFGATWDEIDLKKEVWVIPARRMKMKKEHVVPLTAEMLSILDSLPELNSHLFPGKKNNCSISNMAMAMQMRKMGFGEFTVHGFRSSFRSWAEDKTDYNHAALEKALAHSVKGVEKSYNRGKQLDKRRELMKEWSKYIT